MVRAASTGLTAALLPEDVFELLRTPRPGDSRRFRCSPTSSTCSPDADASPYGIRASPTRAGMCCSGSGIDEPGPPPSRHPSPSRPAATVSPGFVRSAAWPAPIPGRPAADIDLIRDIADAPSCSSARRGRPGRELRHAHPLVLSDLLAAGRRSLNPDRCRRRRDRWLTVVRALAPPRPPVAEINRPRPGRPASVLAATTSRMSQPPISPTCKRRGWAHRWRIPPLHRGWPVAPDPIAEGDPVPAARRTGIVAGLRYCEFLLSVNGASLGSSRSGSWCGPGCPRSAVGNPDPAAAPRPLGGYLSISPRPVTGLAWPSAPPSPEPVPQPRRPRHRGRTPNPSGRRPRLEDICSPAALRLVVRHRNQLSARPEAARARPLALSETSAGRLVVTSAR